MRARAARREQAVSPAPGATAPPARAAAARRASPAPSARRARAAARRARGHRRIPRAPRARAAAPRDRPARAATAGTTGSRARAAAPAARGGGGGTGGPGSCTPMNCSDGCCSSSRRLHSRMRTVTQCGAQGQACAPCGGCQFCSTTGQCRIDTASRWTIVAVGGKAGHRQQLGSEQRRSRRLGARSVLRIREPGGSGQQHDRGRDGHADRHLQPELESGDHAAGRHGVGGDPDGEQSRPGRSGSATTTTAAGWGASARSPARSARRSRRRNLRSGQLIVTNRQQCDSVTINFVCQSPLAGE